ncbi:uncharacterized [Tachysurus ichikawai]
MGSVFNVLQCSQAGGFGSERMKAEHIALHPLLALRKSPHITQRNAACDCGALAPVQACIEGLSRNSVEAQGSSPQPTFSSAMIPTFIVAACQSGSGKSPLVISY